MKATCLIYPVATEPADFLPAEAAVLPGYCWLARIQRISQWSILPVLSASLPAQGNKLLKNIFSWKTGYSS
jgi:hypothetical protein